jgi:hypothetical protein
MKTMRPVWDKNDPKLDKFYDETPKVQFKFELYTTTDRRPYESFYSQRLDGSGEENREAISNIQIQAQSDMFNTLTRLQAMNDECEFSRWVMYDMDGAIIKESTVLSVKIKG